MVIFRCTQKFAKKFGIGFETVNSQKSETLLGDWYLSFFTYQRIDYLLGVSENSLLPVIITAQERKTFPERFRERLSEILRAIGIEQVRVDRELAEFQSISFAPTRSKIVLGCQNDFIRMSSHILRNDPPASLLEYPLQLSKIPFKPIGYDSPGETCLKLFDQEADI